MGLWNSPKVKEREGKFTSIISRLVTWSDGQVLTASALNGEFNNIVNDYNGSITNANISATAAIAISKLATLNESSVVFSGSGHGHTGTTDGKVITINRGYGFFAVGAQIVANDVSWNPAAPAAQTATRLTIHAQTAPTGASLIARVFNITQNATVASVTLTASSTDANTSSMTTAAIAQNDVLRMDITQIGSSVAGSGISLVLNTTQP